MVQFRLCASTPTSLGHFVRLACLRHAASVHPEPGSNSPKKNSFFLSFLLLLKRFHVLLSFQRSFMRFLAESTTNIPNVISFVNTFFKLFLSFFISYTKTIIFNFLFTSKRILLQPRNSFAVQFNI